MDGKREAGDVLMAVIVGQIRLYEEDQELRLKKFFLEALKPNLLAAIAKNRFNCVDHILNSVPALAHTIKEQLIGAENDDDLLSLLHYCVEKDWFDQNTKDSTMVNAVNRNFPNSAAFLLNHGADPNYKLRSYTHLQKAAEGGHDEILQHLLEHGAQPCTADTSSNNTALMEAASGGHVGCVRLLLEHGANRDTQISYRSGLTALKKAAENGHVECCLLLLSSKDLSEYLKTAKSASLAGQFELVMKLVEVYLQKSSPDRIPQEAINEILASAATHTNQDGFIALLAYFEDTFKLTLDENVQFAMMRGAIGSDRNQSLTHLITKFEGDINAPYKGMTLLMYAAANSSVKCIQLLLDSGANPLIQNEEKEKALDLVATFKPPSLKAHSQCEKLLRQAEQEYQQQAQGSAEVVAVATLTTTAAEHSSASGKQRSQERTEKQARP